jgi:hypothetical protein
VAGLCRSCRGGPKHCGECGRPLAKASRVTASGRLCGTCAARHRPPAPCAYCGTTSRHLARSRDLGLTEPACARCRRAGHINCPLCGKNRRPAGSDLISRQAVCILCLRDLGKPYLCPACGMPGQRHSRTRCVACYWRDYGSRLAEDLSGGLPGWAAETFPGFSRALLRRHRDPRAMALRLPRYAEFMAAMAEAFPDPRHAEPSAVLDRFPPDRLRRHRPVADYLFQHVFATPPGLEEIYRHIHRRQQCRLLARENGAWHKQLLRDYHQWLQAIAARYRKAGWVGENARFVGRTVTVSLRAAVHFLQSQPEEFSARQLTQHEIDRFLAIHPGQANALRTFAAFLNERMRLFRKLVIPYSAHPLPSPLPYSHYVALRKQLLADSAAAPKPALVVLLALTFGLSLRRIVRLPLNCLRRSDDGLLCLRVARVDVSLPTDVARLADHYLAERKALAVFDDADRNHYLFPGRTAGRHLEEATAGEYFQRYNLPVSRIASTFYSNAYRLGGLENPKVLVDALGLHPARAIAYFQRFTSPTPPSMP